MTQHVPPPDASERVDYRKLFHQRAMQARQRMESRAKRAEQRMETVSRIREEKEIGTPVRRARPMLIYSAFIGPALPWATIPIAKPTKMVLRVGPDGGTWTEPSVSSIQREVCVRFGVSLNDMLSCRRQAGLVFARQFAMWRVKRETTRSYPDIGQKFGGRDHTTVLHAVRKMDALHASGELAAKGLVP